MTLIMGRMKRDRICYVYSKDFVLETLIYQTDAEMRLLV
jgi:hypothetical protein